LAFGVMMALRMSEVTAFTLVEAVDVIVEGAREFLQP
jgi:hypothetical protein